MVRRFTDPRVEGYPKTNFCDYPLHYQLITRDNRYYVTTPFKNTVYLNDAQFDLLVTREDIIYHITPHNGLTAAKNGSWTFCCIEHFTSSWQLNV